MNPLNQQTRKVDRGWEYVTFLCDQLHLRVMDYQSADDTSEKEGYKRYLCYLCGYPEEEWMRVADVSVRLSAREDCLEITVKFANPGKWYEAAFSNDPKFVMLGVSDPQLDEEAWALTKRMLSKLAFGAESTESQSSVESQTSQR